MVNFTAGENVANQGAVKTWFAGPANPDIKIFASAPTDVVADVVGYYYDATNEVISGDFKRGAALAIYDPVDGLANLKFLTDPATVDVTAPNQLIHVVSSKAFGSSGIPCGSDVTGLRLSICYEKIDPPVGVITSVGAGVGGTNPIAIRAGGFGFAGHTTLQSLNAGISVGPGVYNVGLCGYTLPGNAVCWDQNDAGHTTAFVVQPQ
jgi:hypothetical protein